MPTWSYRGKGHPRMYSWGHPEHRNCCAHMDPQAPLGPYVVLWDIPGCHLSPTGAQLGMCPPLGPSQ